MALDITDYIPDIFQYLRETARLHLVHCIPRLMTSKPPPKVHASWTDSDITRLITFLYEHRTEGTDGGFKKSTYVAAAGDLAPHRNKGGEKNWETCKRQWTKLKNWHRLVSTYRDSSGSVWDPNQNGALYSTPPEEQVFSAYCQKLGNEDGKVLRKLIGGKGWDLFDKIEAIRPVGSTATGHDAHYATQPTDTGPEVWGDIDDKGFLDGGPLVHSDQIMMDIDRSTPQPHLEPQPTQPHPAPPEEPWALSPPTLSMSSKKSQSSTATKSSYSSKGKRKRSAIPEGEFEQHSSKSKRSSRVMSGNRLMTNEPGAAALLSGISGTFTNLSQTVQASTQSTPQGYVKEAIEKLNGAWGNTDGFSAVEKSVLLQLFSSDFKKATTYATNADPEARRLWVDLELLDLQDKIEAAERLFARRRQVQSSGTEPGPSTSTT